MSTLSLSLQIFQLQLTPDKAISMSMLAPTSPVKTNLLVLPRLITVVIINPAFSLNNNPSKTANHSNHKMLNKHHHRSQ